MDLAPLLLLQPRPGRVQSPGFFVLLLVEGLLPGLLQCARLGRVGAPLVRRLLLLHRLHVLGPRRQVVRRRGAGLGLRPDEAAELLRRARGPQHQLLPPGGIRLAAAAAAAAARRCRGRGRLHKVPRSAQGTVKATAEPARIDAPAAAHADRACVPRTEALVEAIQHVDDGRGGAQRIMCRLGRDVVHTTAHTPAATAAAAAAAAVAAATSTTTTTTTTTTDTIAGSSAAACGHEALEALKPAAEVGVLVQQVLLLIEPGLGDAELGLVPLLGLEHLGLPDPLRRQLAVP